jgi:hypothetical protein
MSIAHPTAPLGHTTVGEGHRGHANADRASNARQRALLRVGNECEGRRCGFVGWNRALETQLQIREREGDPESPCGSMCRLLCSVGPAASVEGRMTRDEILDRWRARQAEWTTFDVSLSGAKIAAEVLKEMQELLDADGSEAIGLTEAAERSSYSADHIGRLVRDGNIPNLGRPKAPLVRLRDLPKKPAALRIKPTDTTVDRKRIALAVATSDRRTSNG